MTTKFITTIGSMAAMLAVGLLASLANVAPANAGVIVTQGATPTTTWSSTPTLGTPDASTDNFFSVGGTELEQTITVGASSFTLGKIQFSYGAPSITANLTLYIWQMGGSEDPTAPGFVDNRVSNLLSPNTYAFDTTGGAVSDGSILTFDLTGTDQITLAANTSYVVCLKFNNRTNNPRIGYTEASDNTDANSAYVGGALFYNEAYITLPTIGDAGTDSAFALYAVPEPASLALLGLGGLMLSWRKRRA